MVKEQNIHSTPEAFRPRAGWCNYTDRNLGNLDGTDVSYDSQLQKDFS